MTAAHLVEMAGIAAGNRDVSACPAGDANGDGNVTEDEIAQAIRSLFEGCGEQPLRYDTLTGELYEIVYPTQLSSLAQAAAVHAALEDAGATNTEELKALLRQLLQENGVQAERIRQIGIYAQREQACDECLAECVPRPPKVCLQGPKDCFCLAPIDPDPSPLPPARIVILLLENPEDESLALDAQRLPCLASSFQGGVNDTFSGANGTEAASPGPGLLTLIQQSSMPIPANFDSGAIDQLFGHTFSLPQGKCLREAKVLFRARPLSSSPAPGSRNDVVRLGFVNSTGQFAAPHWAAYFGTGNSGLPALLTQTWVPNNFPASGASFALNLASLPGGVNLLPDLNIRRSLDFFVQDDTSIDYVNLTVRLCDCPCTPAPAGMVGWWPLNETSGKPVSDIAGGHLGMAQPGAIGSIIPPGPVPSTLWPPPSFPIGVVGGALFFSGTRRVEVPHDPALEPGTGDFTVDAWVIFAAAGTSNDLTIVRKVGPGPGYKFVIGDFPPPSLPTLSFETLGSITGYNVNWPIAPNTWHHVAATLQRGATNQTVDLYLDGALVMHYVGPNVGNIANTSNLLIGGDGVAAGQIALDEIEIFNRALTQQEIQAIYQARAYGKCAIPTPTPTATPSRTATPTATRTPTPSITAVPTSTPTVTLSPTRPATSTPSTTPTRTPTATISTTPTRSATATITPTPSPVPTCIAPPAYANMVAWWSLDEPAGAGTVVDSGAPPANNGVPQPGPIGASPPSGPLSVAGNLATTPPDGALYFYTPATYVEVPHSTDLSLAGTDLSIDAWVGPLPGPWSASRDDLHVYSVVDKLNLAANSGYAFYVEVQSSCPTCPPPGQQPPPGGASSTTTMRLVLVLGDGAALVPYSSVPFYGGSGTLFPSPMPPSALTPQPQGWVHVAVTVDRAQATGKFYQGGVQLGTDFTPVSGLDNADPLWIGGTRLYGTAYAPGFIEFSLNEIEVFDVALPQADIQAIAANGAGKCKPTVAPTATASQSATPTPSTPTVTRTPSRTATHTPTRTATGAASFTPTPCIAEICVTKFEDRNHNGLQDSGEPNLAGWVIHIADPGANIIATLFTGMQPCASVPGQGTYTISEVPQGGWTQSFPSAPGTHTVFAECGQLLNLMFGNFENSTPTRTPTRTPTHIPDFPVE